MITTVVLVRIAILKQIKLTTLLALIIFLSAIKVTAQGTPALLNVQKQQLPSSPKDAPAAILEEYNSIVSKYDLSSKKGRKDFHSAITEVDRARLEALYKRMSKKQQSVQIVGFMRSLPPLPEAIPTNKQLEEWENDKVYGVWIDGKKVSNKILSDYSNTDFSHFGISKRSKNAMNHGKHSYQVDLMTKEYYHEYYQQSSANKDKNIIFVKTADK